MQKSNSFTPAKFVDVTSALGVNFVHAAPHTSKKYLLETMGSGVAVFDYDNDGRLDLFFVNGAEIRDPTPPGTVPQKTDAKYWNRLYHQKADGTFEDVTEKAGLKGFGYGMGVAVGDYDNDGYEDLFVTAYGGNRLYHNNGNGTFSDVTEKAGVAGSGWSTSAAWVDLDGDGLLDLIVLRYLQWDFDDRWCGERKPGYRAFWRSLSKSGCPNREKGWELQLPISIRTGTSMSSWPMIPFPNSCIRTEATGRLRKWVCFPVRRSMLTATFMPEWESTSLITIMTVFPIWS
jgi:hypothetical protein